jgi:hypothetical protein
MEATWVALVNVIFENKNTIVKLCQKPEIRGKAKIV